MREDEITRTAVPDHSGGKSLQDSISIEKILVGTVVCICHPSYSWKYKIGLWSRLASAKSNTISPK
jgi:hypothetical protein